MLTLAAIGAALFFTIKWVSKSDEELIIFLKEDDDKDKIYSKEDAENFRKASWISCFILICCLLCYNGVIIGLCAYYAKHIKKGKVLHPAPVLP